MLADLMLIDRCLDGEQAAARELFRQQRGRVQATLYRILGHNRDMDDLLQETFIQVFRSLSGFRGEARLSTWIDRIAVRVAYRHIARKKRSGPTLVFSEVSDGLRSVPGGSAFASQGAAAADLPADLPDRRTMARVGLRRFYDALAQQSARGRIAFALHHIEGRPVAEVADIVGASVTATKLRIWRTRKALLAQAAADPILREFLGDSVLEEVAS